MAIFSLLVLSLVLAFPPLAVLIEILHLGVQLQEVLLLSIPVLFEFLVASGQLYHLLLNACIRKVLLEAESIASWRTSYFSS